jgi:hypothetical protein
MRVSKSLITSERPVPALSVSPIVAALEQVEVDLDEVIAVDAVTETGPTVSSLVEALAEVLDPREARGVRHGVLAVLLLGECAVLTWARSVAAVAEYAHDAGRLVLAALGVGEVVRARVDLAPRAAEGRCDRAGGGVAVLGHGSPRHLTHID